MESQPWTNMDILGILSSLPAPHSRHPTFLLSEGKALLLGQTTPSLSQSTFHLDWEVKSGYSPETPHWEFLKTDFTNRQPVPININFSKRKTRGKAATVQK